ncbi:MAG: hypothetical protein ABIO46_13580 [Chitinophagales bacterium]
MNQTKIVMSACLLFSSFAYAQSSLEMHKHSLSQFSFYVGINSAIYFNDEYTAGPLNSPVAQGGSYVYMFKQIPAISFEAGVHFSHHFNNKIFAETGFNYVQRKKMSEKGQFSYYDTGYQDVAKSLYEDDNFEVPALLGVSFGNLNIKAGAVFPLLSIASRKLIFEDGNRLKVFTHLNFIGSNTDWIYPSLHINYDLAISRSVISPFICIDYIGFPFLHIGTSFTVSKK